MFHIIYFKGKILKVTLFLILILFGSCKDNPYSFDTDDLCITDEFGNLRGSCSDWCPGRSGNEFHVNAAYPNPAFSSTEVRLLVYCPRHTDHAKAYTFSGISQIIIFDSPLDSGEHEIIISPNTFSNQQIKLTVELDNIVCSGDIGYK